jgi:hypothetical protein
VDELRKLGGTPCIHLRARPDPPGCAIHATRPRICRAYACLWLSGALDEEDRPDRLGAVLDLVGQGHGALLRVHEAEPGALERSPRLREIVARYRVSLPVRIAAADRPLDPEAPVRELFPDGSERVVAGDRVIERPASGPERSRRLAWPLRLARRLRDRVRRLRLRGYR